MAGGLWRYDFSNFFGGVTRFAYHWTALGPGGFLGIYVQVPAEHAPVLLAAADAFDEKSLRTALQSWPAATQRRIDTRLKQLLKPKSAAQIAPGRAIHGQTCGVIPQIMLETHKLRSILSHKL